MGLELEGLAIPCPHACGQTFQTYRSAYDHTWNGQKENLWCPISLAQQKSDKVPCPWPECDAVLTCDAYKIHMNSQHRRSISNFPCRLGYGLFNPTIYHQDFYEFHNCVLLKPSKGSKRKL
jgi:hypothetical protein